MSSSSTLNLRLCSLPPGASDNYTYQPGSATHRIGIMVALKEGRDEEQQAFLDVPLQDRPDVTAPRSGWPRALAFYLRLALELTMAAAIGFLLVRLSHVSSEPSLRPSPVPQFPRKTYVFREDRRYLNEGMFASREATIHTLHNWVELSARARGYVQIPDRTSYNDLGEPYTVPVNLTHDGPAYMMSVFHQLHCLSYLVQQFQGGYAGVELEQEVAHHAAHCFDYLRQSIMCAGDTTLEGKTSAGPGWGSKHECVDYDALLSWTDKNGAKPWRGNMPEETVL